MNTLLKKGLLITATCLASASALASPVIRETGLANGLWSGGLVLPIQGGSAGYWSGLQTIMIDNTQSLLAFCVDPWEWSPSSNQPYSASNSLGEIFASAKTAQIRELYSEAYGGTLLANAAGKLNAAAFQLALWEIIVDSDFNLATGGVRMVSDTNADLVSATEALLHIIDGRFGSERYAFQLYTSGRSAGQLGTAGSQDYLVVSRIPEPGVAGLLLTALGCLGLFTRRRKQPA